MPAATRQRRSATPKEFAGIDALPSLAAGGVNQLLLAVASCRRDATDVDEPQPDTGAGAPNAYSHPSPEMTRPRRRVVEARRPGQGFCHLLLVRDGPLIALLVHALDDLRVELDDSARVALIQAIVDLGGESGRCPVR